MKIRDKRFFVTMGVCVVAVGAVAAVSLSYSFPKEGTVPPVNTATTTTTTTTAAITTTDAQQVQRPVTDVVDTRTTTTVSG